VTPNQFYLLLCIREGLSAEGINLHQELRALSCNDEFIIGNTKDSYKLTPKAEELLLTVESYFKVKSKKTAIAVMGNEYAENIVKYNEIFPRVKLPSGKIARTPLRMVEANFKWFFENHKYSWETIFTATARYVDEYELKSPAYMYMRNSGYFICKMSHDKIRESTLAEYCDMVDSKEDIIVPHFFKDKTL